jgi:hypothetical protein
LLRGNILLLMPIEGNVDFLVKMPFFKRYLKKCLDGRVQKMVEFQLQTRGGAVWQLVGLITRRS